ncbi:hypothetical protein [Flavobacterium sp. MDT1-60]|uniref:hypothetical protein n=1 Tax=Flavobacterium sp. MDT1-60 TaxID=1979344 RepID=UPI00177E85D8|nr:hypothetical protein [Flavobacterium sp. MDT1-60]QOG04488.1 hypothetical protein IHE43_09885 [Flavobacterium sp. MDT1-60]
MRVSISIISGVTVEPFGGVVVVLLTTAFGVALEAGFTGVLADAFTVATGAFAAVLGALLTGAFGDALCAAGFASTVFSVACLAGSAVVVSVFFTAGVLVVLFIIIVCFIDYNSLELRRSWKSIIS